MKTFKVTEDTNLKDFTDSVYPQGSFCLAALLRGNDVKVNGARTGVNVALRRGDEVVYYTTSKQEEKPSHNPVYEDENVYIADKFSGVSSEGLFCELCGKGEFYAVHRLDRNTQGLIVYAKNKLAEGELLSAFREGKIHKTYYAVCKNAFRQKNAKLTAYLVKEGDKVKVYPSPRAGALTAVTEYSVEEERGDTALVKINLHTGRTHQIRAHMAFIGCPVLGDEKYGDRELNKKYSAKRQRLTAKYISFGLDGGLGYLNGKSFVSAFDF